MDAFLSSMFTTVIYPPFLDELARDFDIVAGKQEIKIPDVKPGDDYRIVCE